MQDLFLDRLALLDEVRVVEGYFEVAGGGGRAGSGGGCGWGCGCGGVG